MGDGVSVAADGLQRAFPVDCLTMSQQNARTLVIALAAAALLGGCVNSSINTLQFSGATEPFPADYNAAAAKEIKARKIVASGLQVSYPRTVLGETPFSPKRWYLCVLGVPTSKTPATAWPNLTQLAENALRRTPAPGVFDLLLFLHAGQTPGSVEAFDAELCRDGVYEPLRG